MENIIAQKTAKLLLKIKAVSFRFDPPFIFTSGIKSPIYLDNRLVMSYPEVRKKIIDFYIKLIKNKIGINKVEWISATATAAIPQGCWVADKLNLPMVFVRPTTKAYGKGNKMEGYMKKGAKVVIIEDHISTATNVIGNAQTIKELGGTVKYCIATTSYETKKSIVLLKENNIKLITLTAGKKIVEEALNEKIINLKEKEQVDLWFKDPMNWGK
ncbi:orotate phosphoribosyltransferase [Candidatus Roizmanbacteria bacterium CG2_30_33_16]|uniref:Orotate phosphoribosyltransferase n=3 Tax=Candidatus Roizmaniibacteriota TaxID=1752723 RepID=A0A2M7M093_9BACT|nr:orotate phosphoribosyltransferase [Candidatus Roizmanbacteria bacterium]OIP84140.1 MAG: orotate phosphoribosyltransferase [Candidatus Roizmanbacteria bacterium CG2_30_33_16]PIX73750.1 MAG: orotate phosphoribosyltransferase [Candidatus Roizmanbacteria bacterium CG_4_10_14_3_um_filter_33_21]PJB88261.1 MAG: orotate phosphoribosyltransferase [Candidatus Roizmanbacteria bacterium CG_4_9_14_0_8_um_filter_34_12]